jgi:hypothetical protein
MRNTDTHKLAWVQILYKLALDQALQNFSDSNQPLMATFAGRSTLS